MIGSPRLRIPTARHLEESACARPGPRRAAVAAAAMTILMASLGPPGLLAAPPTELPAVHSLGASEPLEVSLLEAAWAQERVRLGETTWVPSRDQKLLVFRLALRNPGLQGRRITPDSLSLSVRSPGVPSTQVPAPLRLATSGVPVDPVLPPGQGIVALGVVTMEVDDPGAELVVTLADAELALSLADATAGFVYRRELPLSRGEFVPLGHLDLRFEGASASREDALYVVSVTFRNGATVPWRGSCPRGLLELSDGFILEAVEVRWSGEAVAASLGIGPDTDVPVEYRFRLAATPGVRPAQFRIHEGRGRYRFADLAPEAATGAPPPTEVSSGVPDPDSPPLPAPGFFGGDHLVDATCGRTVALGFECGEPLAPGAAYQILREGEVVGEVDAAEACPEGPRTRGRVLDASASVDGFHTYHLQLRDAAGRPGLRTGGLMVLVETEGTACQVAGDPAQGGTCSAGRCVPSDSGAGLLAP